MKVLPDTQKQGWVATEALKPVMRDILDAGISPAALMVALYNTLHAVLVDAGANPREIARPSRQFHRNITHRKDVKEDVARAFETLGGVVTKLTLRGLSPDAIAYALAGGMVMLYRTGKGIRQEQVEFFKKSLCEQIRIVKAA